MKPIEYRYWSKQEKVMVHHNQIGFSVENMPVCSDHVGEGIQKHVHLCDLVSYLEARGDLMPFTGMLDCNGRKVFVGDILKMNVDGKTVLGVMEFDLKRFTFGVNTEVSFTPTGMTPTGHVLQSTSKDGRPEVVGNFYENPELLSNLKQ